MVMWMSVCPISRRIVSMFVSPVKVKGARPASPLGVRQNGVSGVTGVLEWMYASSWPSSFSRTVRRGEAG